MSPGNIIEWRCLKFPNVYSRWRIIGIHLGGQTKDGTYTESLIEMESTTHDAGCTGEWEWHPRVFVPEVLVRDLKIVG